MANINETAVTPIDCDWCSGVIGHSNENHHLSEEVKRLREENAELLESLRMMAHSGMGSGMDPLQVIANEVQAAIPTKQGQLLAAMLREGVTELRSHIVSAVESMPTQRGADFEGAEQPTERPADQLFPNADVSPSERRLRHLLAVRVGMPHTYYDDGEAQGSEHGICIDFMRDSVEDLDAKLRALNVARANVPPMTDEDILSCVRSVGTPTPMGLIREHGPYDVSEPTYFSRRFVEAIVAKLRGQTK